MSNRIESGSARSILGKRLSGGKLAGLTLAAVMAMELLVVAFFSGVGLGGVEVEAANLDGAESQAVEMVANCRYGVATKAKTDQRKWVDDLGWI